MRKHNQKDIDSLVNKILSETLEEKANSLVSRLNNKEVNELGGMGGNPHPKFGEKNFSKMSSKEIEDLLNDYGDDSDDDNEYKDLSSDNPYYGDDDDDMSDILDYEEDVMNKSLEDDDYDELDEDNSEMCECGGKLYEGTCNECGGSYGSMDEEDEYDTDNSDEDNKTCEFHREHFGEDDERTQRFCKSLNESLKGDQKKLDKNKNNKIDSEDFKLLRGKKTETKEGKPDFLDLDKDGDKKEPMKKASKDVKNKKGKKESVKLSESELIDLIESIVKEDMKGAKHRGMSEYEKAHKGSGKESDDYIKSVTKKMSDYLKDGSKGDYDMNPKMFPKGNGQIEKMNTKKYTMSKDGEEFVDNFLRPGQENLEYDEIEPNEEWMKGNIEGSSKTGNNSEWANAEETGLGEKINKKRKENKFAKLRRQAYNKAPQPTVSDKTGEESGKGVNIKLESTDKQTKVLNEEFTKIQHLMGYSRKTQ
jgi:hypothetical protein